MPDILNCLWHTNELQEPHRHPGVFVARGKEDLLITKNLRPGESVYGEKRIAVENSLVPSVDGEVDSLTKTEYRVWNPFRSKLAAGILGGLDEIFIRPGSKVLYLGAASGTSVSHVADIVGSKGIVFAVEFSHRSGRDLINMATHRTNVIPIIEDARHPLRYRMLVSMVDVIFADVAQPDQARIVGLNAHNYLKVGGGVVVSIKANCIDSTAAPEQVFAREVQKMKEEKIKPFEQLTLEPYERGELTFVPFSGNKLHLCLRASHTSQFANSCMCVNSRSLYCNRILHALPQRMNSKFFFFFFFFFMYHRNPLPPQHAGSFLANDQIGMEDFFNISVGIPCFHIPLTIPASQSNL